MRELEVLASNQEQAIEKAAEKAETKAEYLEIIEEYEPDEIDLKQYQEEEGLDAPLGKDEITLYVVRLGYSYYLEKAQQWTQGLIERFAPDSTATAVKFRDIIIIRLEVPETSILIGKKGATLDALQHVVVRALLTKDEKFPDIMLDVEGYRESKLSRLEKEARQAANRALRSGRGVPLTPMSPAERKFIHNMLKDMEDIQTESRGQDRGRHIVVEPTGAAAQGKRGRGGRSRGGGRSGSGKQGHRPSTRPQGTVGSLAKDSRPDEITEEQRQLLYGRMAAQREREEEEAREQLYEEKHSLLPEYVPEDKDDDEEDDEMGLVDELE